MAHGTLIVTPFASTKHTAEILGVSSSRKRQLLRILESEMPFKLGLSVAWDKFGSRPHGWFVFEAKRSRLAKSLSDLSGTDIYLHNGRIDGVFRELCDAFVRRDQQPSVQQMWRIYRDLRKS